MTMKNRDKQEAHVTYIDEIMLYVWQVPSTQKNPLLSWKNFTGQY